MCWQLLSLSFSFASGQKWLKTFPKFVPSDQLELAWMCAILEHHINCPLSPDGTNQVFVAKDGPRANPSTTCLRDQVCGDSQVAEEEHK